MSDPALPTTTIETPAASIVGWRKLIVTCVATVTIGVVRAIVPADFDLTEIVTAIAGMVTAYLATQGTIDFTVARKS